MFAHKKGEPAYVIARTLDVGKTQVQNIIRDAETILDRWTQGDAGDSKISKRMKTQFSDLNDQVWEWFCDARSRKVPVSGFCCILCLIIFTFNLFYEIYCFQ